MHDVAIIRVPAEIVGDDFAEGFREDAFVDIFNGVVDVFLGGGHAALVVSFVVSHTVVVSVAS